MTFIITQTPFAARSGFMSVVFAIAYVTVAALSAALGGIRTPRPSDQVVAVTEVRVAA